MPGLGIFCDCNSRILLLKLGLQKNTENYFKDKTRTSYVISQLSCFLGYLYLFEETIHNVYV